MKRKVENTNEEKKKPKLSSFVTSLAPKKVYEFPYHPINLRSRSMIENKKFLMSNPATWKDLIKYRWLESLVKKYPDICQVYVLPQECILAYIPNFYRAEYTVPIVDDLGKLELKEAIIYKKPTPRAIAWLVDYDHLQISNKSYKFSGQEQKTQPMPDSVKRMMKELDDTLCMELNSALVNKYRKEKIYDEKGNWIRGAGKESIQPHRDKELWPEGNSQNIVSVSLGQRRIFDVRYIQDGKAKHHLQFYLGKGDLFIMGENTNRYCTHGIPKEPKLHVTEHRYSITFRNVSPLFHVGYD